MMDKEQQKKTLIRRLHALRTEYRMTQDEYDSLLSSYGVESSREMTCDQLHRACQFVVAANGGSNREEAQRRRLIATACRMLAEVVEGWHAMVPSECVEYAKAVSCRAAGMSRYDSHGKDNFNRMTVERMRSLCYAFDKRRRDMERAATVAAEILSGKEVAE